MPLEQPQLNKPIMARIMPFISSLALATGLYFILNFGGFIGERFDTESSAQPLSFALLFIAGTLTGFHCAGMCGSLVVGYTVKMASDGKPNYWTHVFYALGKTLSYTLIGASFGAVGAIVTFTPFMRGTAGILAGVFLVLYGVSSLRLFSGLNRFGVRPPAVLMQWLGKAYRNNSGPFVIGVLNGFMIICGPLQAMYIMAAGTGNPIEGAKMLFAFALGTLPLMMGFGFLASAFSKQLAPKLVRASGLIVIALGIIMLNRGYVLLRYGIDPHSMMRGHMSMNQEILSGSSPPPSTLVETMIHQPGTLADPIPLEANSNIEWTINLMNPEACGSKIQIQELKKSFDLQAGENQLIFKTQDPTQLHWRCENNKTQGTFSVEATTLEQPNEKEEPRTQLIHELIEKSAEALENLMDHLHP